MSHLSQMQELRRSWIRACAADAVDELEGIADVDDPDELIQRIYSAHRHIGSAMAEILAGYPG